MKADYISSMSITKDLEIINENGNIMVLDRGAIMCVTDSWAKALDYIEQQYGE